MSFLKATNGSSPWFEKKRQIDSTKCWHTRGEIVLGPDDGHIIEIERGHWRVYTRTDDVRNLRKTETRRGLYILIHEQD